MRAVAVACTAALMLVAAAPAPAPAPLPGWMAGCWVAETETRWTEECWTSAKAGSMLGSSRTVVDGKLAEWEAMQILTGADGRPVFSASPDGAARTYFPMISGGAAEIVFANPKHDYPQRIRYWREGAALNAEISKADGTRPRRWTFRRAG